MAEAKNEKGAKPAKADKAKAAPAEAKGKGRAAQTEVAAAGKVSSAPKDYVARL